jgi:YHS domain-containing protein
MATYPVCKMTVGEKKAAGKSEYNGKTYYFCSTSCKSKFDQSPHTYAK